MRTVFVSPSVADFAILFGETSLKNIRGGALSDIEIYKIPNRSIRGGGLFSFLSGIARRVVPLIGRAMKPAAIEFGKNVFTDLQNGNTSLKQVLKRRGAEAVVSTARKVLRGQGRGGIKKKKKNLKKVSTCPFSKKKKGDIFSSF